MVNKDRTPAADAPLGVNLTTRQRAAIKGGFRTARVEDILNMLNEELGPEDLVSRLRLLSRVRRVSERNLITWPIELDLDLEIARCYRRQAESAKDDVEKLLYARWACRYGIEDFDWLSLLRSFNSYCHGRADNLQKIMALARADIPSTTSVDPGECRAYFDDGSTTFFEVVPRRTVTSMLILSRERKANARLEITSWSFSVSMLTGGKPSNEDAVLFAAFSDKSFLVAVADGTGDSSDGARAAEVILESLPEFLAISDNLESAVELAAGKLRADNMKRKQENCCTLVAVHVAGNDTDHVRIGDTFYWMQARNKPPVWSDTGKLGRFNLGGEPLGYTITSSLNRVDHFVSFAGAPQHGGGKTKGLDALVLGSDGLLPLPDVVEEVGSCPLDVDVERRLKEPWRISDACSAVALKAMEEGRRTRDNITCLVGVRRP